MNDALDVTIDQLYVRQNDAARNETARKDFLIAQLKLLSAVESWSFSVGHPLPDYLHDQLALLMAEVEKELRK